MAQFVVDLNRAPDAEWSVKSITTTSTTGTTKIFSHLVKDWPDGANTEVLAGIIAMLNLQGHTSIACVGGKGRSEAEHGLVRQMQNLWNDWKRDQPRLKWLKNLFEREDGDDSTKVKLSDILCVVNRRSGATVTYSRTGDDRRELGTLLLNGKPMDDHAARNFLKEAFAFDAAASTSHLPCLRLQHEVSTKDGHIRGDRYPVSQARLTCCAWNPDGSTLYASGFDGILYSLSALAPTVPLRLTSAIVRTIRVSVRAGLLLAGDDAGHITGVQLANNAVSLIAECMSPVYSITESERSRTIAIAERSGAVDEWRIALGAFNPASNRMASRRLRTLYSHQAAAFSVRYDSRRKRYISVGADGILRWSVLDGGNVEERKLADVALFGLSIGASDGPIAVGDAAGRIYLCGDGDIGQPLTGHEDTVRTLEFSPRGTWLFSGSKDRTVRLWHCASGQTWIVAQVDDYVYDVALSPDGGTLAIVDGAGIVSCVTFPKEIDKLTPRNVSKLLEEWDGFESQ